MKKITKIFLSIFVLTAIITPVHDSLVSAQNKITEKADTSASKNGTSEIFTLQNPLKVDSIGGLINALLEIITYLLIILAVLMIIWIGFQFVYNASVGNSSKLTELRSRLLWLVAGVAILIGARVIIQVVINTISATGSVSPQVIESANKAVQGR